MRYQLFLDSIQFNLKWMNWREMATVGDQLEHVTTWWPGRWFTCHRPGDSNEPSPWLADGANFELWSWAWSWAILRVYWPTGSIGASSGVANFPISAAPLTGCNSDARSSPPGGTLSRIAQQTFFPDQNGGENGRPQGKVRQVQTAR